MTGLQADDLSCGYPGRPVLRQISLAVRGGEVLALLGPNGAGKTTLLRAMARLLRPSQGHVLLQGRDVWRFSPRDMARQAALSPQSEGRDWPLTVREAVLLGRVPHRGLLAPFTAEDRALVEQALQGCGLQELAERPITQLSGGEWRRVVLARALAQSPRVLLLDEPTAQLDLRHQLEILQHVRQLAEIQMLAVVMTLHDLNQAALYAHRLALLDGGQLVATGPPRDVLTAELLSRTYGVQVAVTRHPLFDVPLVVPVGEWSPGAAEKGQA